MSGAGHELLSHKQTTYKLITLIWPWVKTNHFGVGEFTAHFGTYFSGWIESDVP